MFQICHRAFELGVKSGMARMNCTTIDIAPKKHRTIFESDYTTVPTNGQRMKVVARHQGDHFCGIS